MVLSTLTTVRAQECAVPQGDVNLDGHLTPADAQVAFQHVLGQTALVECAQAQANVFETAQGDITPADVLCIFRRYLHLPSCLDTSPPVVTMFPGGTLPDLRALSPDLTFDHLMITGRLDLPPNDMVILRVNDLTITPEGSIGYSQGECSYFPAPDVTINATGTVVIEGGIALIGKSGRGETTGSTCNQCNAAAGGDLQITAQSLTIAEALRVNGGSGSNFRDANVSLGCSGGASGQITLDATALSLRSATLQASGGSGGFGGDRNGADGAEGSLSLSATEVVHMRGGLVNTDGTLTLTTAQTDILGALQYGQLIESIAGQTDTEPPVVSILAPLPDTSIALDASLEIRVQVQDRGTGVREVQVSGLGHEQLHAADDLDDGLLTIALAQPGTPASLRVTAVDNRANSTVQTVEGLSLMGTLRIDQGEMFVLNEDLLLGDAATVDIAGTLIVPQGSTSTIQAGSLRLAASGTIIYELETEVTVAQAPTLTLLLEDTVMLAGTVNLNGHDGLPLADQQGGEQGGVLVVRAAAVNVAGDITVNGGAGVTRPLNINQRLGASGGGGGLVSLSASTTLQISGRITANGGTSVNTGLAGCFNGGAGGTLQFTSVTPPSIAEATFEVSGGTANQQFFCEAATGAQGSVELVNLSPPLADAGANQVVATAGTTVTLDGSASTAPGLQPLSFAWSLRSQPSGSLATLSDPRVVRPTFVADTPGVYIAQLVVSDGTTESAADQVTIVVPRSGEADLLVSSGSTNAVLRYDGNDGSPLDAFVEAGAGGLTFPIGLVFGSDGHLYVSSANTNAVLRYDGQSGELLDAFVNTGAGGLAGPVGLTFGADGHLYVSSADTNAILRYDGTSGAFLDVFVPSGEGGLNFPAGVLFGPDGHLYVSSVNSNQVLRYDGQSGAFLNVFVAAGSGGLDFPLGLTFGADAQLYVTSGSTDAILRYDGQSGAFRDAFVASGSGGLDFPMGLTFGPDGHLYVSSAATDAVLRYHGQAGSFLEEFVPTASGGLDNPEFLIFTPLLPVNHSPIADAGSDRRVALESPISLDGMASRDVEGEFLTFSWSIVSHPAGSTATFSNAGSATPTLTVDAIGVYVVELTVNDGVFDSTADTLTVVVRP